MRSGYYKQVDLYLTILFVLISGFHLNYKTMYISARTSSSFIDGSTKSYNLIILIISIKLIFNTF